MLRIQGLVRLGLVCVGLAVGTVCAFAQTVASVTLSPSTVTASCSTTGTVTMSFAPSSNMTIDLSASTDQVTVPSTVTIPAGSTSATFTVTTTDQGGNYSVSIYAVRPQNSSAKAILTVTEDTVASVSLSPNTVTGGTATTGTVTLATAATGSFVVNLSSSIGQITVPATATVAAGSKTATFTATASNTGSGYVGSIYATTEHSSAKAVLTAVDNPIVSLAFSPSTVSGGAATTGTVTLSSAPTGTFTVDISASTDQVTVPSTMTIAKGSTSGTFTVQTQNLGGAYSLSLYASNPHSSAKAVLTVVEDAIASLSLSPSSVTTGGTTTGTVTLSAAPTGNLTVNLSSSTPLISVPSTVTVAKGSTTGSFTVMAAVSGTAYTGKVYATNKDTSAAAVLTATPISQWFTYGGNFQRTGLGLGSGSTGTLAWSKTPTGYELSSVVLRPNHDIVTVDSQGNILELSTTGSTLWTYATSDGIGAPTLDANGNVIVVGTSGYVYSVSSTGSLNWKTDTNNLLFGAIAIDSQGNIIASGYSSSANSEVVISLSPSGTMNWTFNAIDSAINMPTIDLKGNTIVCGVGGYVQSISSSGKLNWTFDTNEDLLEAPVAIDRSGNIIVSTEGGTIVSISPTGSQNWVKAFGGESFYVTPAIDANGNIIICGTATPNIYSLNSSGMTNWTYTAQAYSYGAASVDAKGNAITTDYDGNIYSINSSGHLNWTYSTGQSQFLDPAVIDSNGRIYIPGTAGLLMALN